MGKFKGSLYTEFLPPRFWRLTEALKLNTDTLNDVDKQMLNEIPGIKCTKAGMITVPEGYITDLASVPRIADKVFLEGMKSAFPNQPSWKIYSCFWAVRIFGRWAIKKSQPRG